MILEPFQSFPKIPRWRRDIIITEKIDGTNAQLLIYEDPEVPVLIGSRNRWLDPDAPQGDNYGFAAWVRQHEADLKRLGPGRHFGEWWGQGINRRYGQDRKRFSLFNVDEWTPARLESLGLTGLVEVVPTLHRGPMEDGVIESVVETLRLYGSVAAPGFAQPEGVVIFHTASRSRWKYTLENDRAKSEYAVDPAREGAEPQSALG